MLSAACWMLAGHVRGEDPKGRRRLGEDQARRGRSARCRRGSLGGQISRQIALEQRCSSDRRRSASKASTASASTAIGPRGVSRQSGDEFGVRRPNGVCGWFGARACDQRANCVSHVISLGHGLPPWLGLGPVGSSRFPLARLAFYVIQIIGRSQFPYYEKNAAARELARIPCWRYGFRPRSGPLLKAGPSSKKTSPRARKQFAA